MATTGKRRRVEQLVLDVFSALDKTGGNTAHYRAFFKSMSDEQFARWIGGFLRDEEENFYLEAIPGRNEPALADIEKAAKILGVPLNERVTFPHLGGVKTREAVPVGWLLIKRHQQIVSKKNDAAQGARQRNPRTGQVTGEDKSARTSDMEHYSLQTVGAEHALEELLGPRADDLRAKGRMYEKIGSEGFVNLSELPAEPRNRVTLNTINTLLLGAGIRSDLINRGLLLQISADRPQEVKKR